LGALVAANFEDPVAYDPYLDLVAFLEIKRVNNGGRQPNGQTVAPFRHLHGSSLMIYINIVYHKDGLGNVQNPVSQSNIRVINRRENHLDHDLRCLLRAKEERRKKKEERRKKKEENSCS
jgi:hypothetical protein